MENKDYDNRSDDFWNVVQDAITTGDFRQLNDKVKDTIADSVEAVKEGVRTGTQTARDFHASGTSVNEWRANRLRRTYTTTQYRREGPLYQPNGQVQRKQQTVVNPAPQLPAVYRQNPPGQVSGLLMEIAGYGMTGLFGILAFSFGITMLVDNSVAWPITTGVMSVLTAASAVFGIAGSKIRGRVKRFRSYVRQIGSRAYCSIEELAGRVGKDKDYVIRDLEKMIDKRMFLQGHLDEQCTCLIVTNEMYKQYLEVQKQARDQKARQELEESRQAQLPEECQKVLTEGRNYIRYIRECNDDIPGEEISAKLSRLELIISRIFDEVEKNPSLAGDLRKFMNYYLPTVRKLLDAYREVEKDPVPSESMQKTKQEIEATLDTINQAFENLLSSFFDERAMDISSDITVLHSMFAQEGLIGKDFTINTNTEHKEENHE